jgi:TonB-dependent SusC/RagA subfamily outer membrane receptor
MKIFFIVILMIVHTATVNAQKPALETAVSRLNSYFEEQPREKIYLHLDKPLYQPGERIWFKAYLTAGNFNQLSPISKIIYVELINAEAEIVFAVRLPANSGISYGDIPVPEGTPAGNYRIRAYSNWMRNFNPGYFYNREIRIGQAGDTTAGKQADTRPSLNFFTENGRNIVAGLENNIVFKIDRPISGARLKIVDTEGAIVREIEPDASGIGNFSFSPEAGSGYLAVLSSPGAEEIPTPLPEVVPDGILIQSNVSRPDDIFIRLSAGPAMAQGQPVKIIIQKDGEVFYAAKHSIGKEQSTFSVRKDHFPTGLADIGVFSDDMELLAQKSIFIRRAESELAIEASSDQEVYRAREKVSVDIRAGLENDSLRVASLSVSVTHQDKVPSDSLAGTNIWTSLYLESESASEIASPGRYAPSDAIADQIKVDQLAMTLARDKLWQFATQESEKTIEYSAERDLTISGQVTRKNGDPVPFAKVLVLASELGSVMDTVADENGRFVFDRLLFYGNTKFVVQARDEKGRRQVNILLDEGGGHQITANEISGSTVPSRGGKLFPDTNTLSFDALLQAGRNDRSILLDDVEVRTERRNPAANSSNLNGAGNADQIIAADELETCSDLTVCLQGRLLGVIFMNGVPYSTRSPHIPMQVIVDGMYLDGQALTMIPVFDVASVEVLRRPSTLGIYGSRGAGGVIIVTTKRGGTDFSTDLHTPGIVTHSSQGLYEISTFKSPDYSRTDSTDMQPDRRSTIYWNPNIITNEEGRASFDFYTADEPGTYRIVIEGVDIYGRIGRKELFIEIVNENK